MNGLDAKNENKLGNCWFCNEECLEQLMEPVDSKYCLRNSPVLICKSCGFVFKKPCVGPQELDDDLNTVHYKSYTFDKLLERSKARAQVDTCRAVEYINYIRNTVDMNNVKRALDIGGAEGLFSNTLKTVCPNIEVYCLEPDNKVVAIGKQLYPEVNFLEGRLENILSFQEIKFDLVTYFGGFYRTVEPRIALKNIHTCMSVNGHIVFSLPHSLDNPGKQACEPFDSIDDLLTYAPFLMLNDYYMTSFIKYYFKLVTFDKRQNYPFFKKIQFYIAQKRKDISEFQFSNSNRYEANRNVIFQYANDVTKERLKSLKEKYSLRNIVIYGIEPEADILSQIAISIDVKVVFFVDPFCLESDGRNISGIPVKLLSEIYHENIDALIIANYECQNDIYDQLKNRLHLDQRLLVVKGFGEKKYVNNRVSFVHEGNIKLQKAFSFIVE